MAERRASPRTTRAGALLAAAAATVLAVAPVAAGDDTDATMRVVNLTDATLEVRVGDADGGDWELRGELAAGEMSDRGEFAAGEEVDAEVRVEGEIVAGEALDDEEEPPTPPDDTDGTDGGDDAGAEETLPGEDVVRRGSGEMRLRLDQGAHALLLHPDDDEWEAAPDGTVGHHLVGHTRHHEQQRTTEQADTDPPAELTVVHTGDAPIDVAEVDGEGKTQPLGQAQPRTRFTNARPAEMAGPTTLRLGDEDVEVALESGDLVAVYHHPGVATATETLADVVAAPLVTGDPDAEDGADEPTGGADDLVTGEEEPGEETGEEVGQADSEDGDPPLWEPIDLLLAAAALAAASAFAAWRWRAAQRRDGATQTGEPAS